MVHPSSFSLEDLARFWRTRPGNPKDIHKNDRERKKKKTTKDNSYLLKTLFPSRERDVFASCFMSVRLGYFFFVFLFFFPPFPFVSKWEEPRSTPVAASTSLMKSGSRHSDEMIKTNKYDPCARDSSPTAFLLAMLWFGSHNLSNKALYLHLLNEFIFCMVLH